jgi:hypothetical protein
LGQLAPQVQPVLRDLRDYKAIRAQLVPQAQLEQLVLPVLEQLVLQAL